MVSVTNGPGAGGYATWAAANAGGASAPVDDDFDNDGVENGVEFFYGATGSSFTSGSAVDNGTSVTYTPTQGEPKRFVRLAVDPS